MKRPNPTAAFFSLPARFGCPAAILVVLVVLLGRVAAADDRAAFWLKDDPYYERLGRRISVSWSEVPLRQALTELSESQQVAILLDRRIDPDRPIELGASAIALEELLVKVARERNAGLSILNGVVYLGPADVAKKLRTLVDLIDQQVERIPSANRARWTQEQPLAWDNAASPRAIVAELARASGVELVGMEAIARDLWGAAALPPLSLAERLSLVLVQFDLTVALDQSGLKARLVAIPPTCAIERGYPGGRSATQLAKKWSALLPGARIRVRGNRVLVTARAEEHDQLSGKGARRAAPSGAADIEKLRIESLSLEQRPLDAVVAGLAQRLSLSVEYDRSRIEEAGIALDQPINVNIKRASVDEALRAVLAQAGLTFERSGREVRIRPTQQAATTNPDRRAPPK